MKNYKQKETSMKNFISFYNERYAGSYRYKLKGYEYTRSIAVQNVINNKLNILRIENVLDYGSGSGLHIELWKNLFPNANLYCCDISSVALKVLIKKHPKLNENTRMILNNKAQLKMTSLMSY